MKRPINVLFLLLIFNLLSTAAYATDIHQGDIPLTITLPGQYVVQENLTYGQSGSAITIKANDVELDFGSFSLTLTNHKATGILVDGASAFIIKGNVIKNTSSKKRKGEGIHIAHANNGMIDNITAIHHHNGLSIKKSHGIQIQNSTFVHAIHAGSFVKDSTGIAFNNCTFTHSHNGLTFHGNNEDCRIINCEFPSARFSNLNVQQVNGMIIENCSFTNDGGDAAKPNLVQFGGANPKDICNDIIMRNCTIINRPSHTPHLGNTAPEGLGIYQGSGFLVESCVIDIDNTNQDPDADLSGIHISNPGLGANGTIASNVIIRNCVIQGPATDGVYPDVGSSGVVIENCLVTGALKDGIFLAGTSASTVANNTVVNNGTNGIFVGETSTSNAISGNIVNSNGTNPILTSIPPFGNGIAIASDSSMNIIQGNTVFNNAVNGIDDQGTNNQIYNNTAYANANNNYNAATDIIIVSNPGNPALTAANIAP